MTANPTVTERDLFLAILAMDTYHVASGVDLESGAVSTDIKILTGVDETKGIGLATRQAAVFHRADSFYAVNYSWDGSHAEYDILIRG